MDQKLFDRVIADLVESATTITEAVQRGMRLGMLLESVMAEGFAPFEPPTRETISVPPEKPVVSETNERNANA